MIKIGNPHFMICAREGSVMGISAFLSAHGDALLYGAISSAVTLVPGWIVVNMLLKPILAIRDKRIEALQVGDRYTFVSSAAPEERIRDVRYKLNDIASDLRSLARGHSMISRLYCRFLEYDLEKAAAVLSGLAEMAGREYSDEFRRNNADALHWCLRAHRHLSADRLVAIQEMLAASFATNEGNPQLSTIERPLEVRAD